MARAALAHVTSAAPVRLGFGGLLVTTIVDPGNTGIALLEEAQRTLPPGDSSLRARTLARLAAELYQFHETDRSRALAGEAVDMALRLGDPEALVESLHGRHWATLSPDSTGDRLANAQEMLLAATGAGDEEAAFLARHARLHCFLELCDIARVDAELAAMEQLAARIRQPFYVWHVACLHGMRALLDGRLHDADRMLATAFARVRESEDVVYMYEDAQVFAIRWAQGRLGERRDRTTRHGELYPIARWRDALSAAELGDERAARAEIERHARNGFADLPRDGLWLMHMCALAHACALVGDVASRGIALRAALAVRRSSRDLRLDAAVRSGRDAAGDARRAPRAVGGRRGALPHGDGAVRRDGSTGDPRDGAHRARADARRSTWSRRRRACPSACSPTRSRSATSSTCRASANVR